MIYLDTYKEKIGHLIYMTYFLFYTCKYLVTGKSVMLVLIYFTINVAIWNIEERYDIILLAKE